MNAQLAWNNPFAWAMSLFPLLVIVALLILGVFQSRRYH